MDKAQCIYCGRIIYVDSTYGNELYEDDGRRNKISRFERCSSNRTNSGELGYHKYDILPKF